MHVMSCVIQMSAIGEAGIDSGSFGVGGESARRLRNLLQLPWYTHEQLAILGEARESRV